MPKRVTDYRQTLIKSLADPREAALYLEASSEDSDEMFLTALRDVAEARRIANVAKGAGVAREAVYRMLSPKGNPTYRNLRGILKSLGLKLRVDVLADTGENRILEQPPHAEPFLAADSVKLEPLTMVDVLDSAKIQTAWTYPGGYTSPAFRAFTDFAGGTCTIRHNNMIQLEAISSISEVLLSSLPLQSSLTQEDLIHA